MLTLYHLTPEENERNTRETEHIFAEIYRQAVQEAKEQELLAANPEEVAPTPVTNYEVVELGKENHAMRTSAESVVMTVKNELKSLIDPPEPEVPELEDPWPQSPVPELPADLTLPLQELEFEP